MKTFKLLSMVLIAIFISTSFTACSNDEEPVVPPVEDEYIDVPLKLSIDASIDITDEPISRAGNQNPVYAIEVQEINPNTSLTSSYAYGIFKSLDNIEGGNLAASKIRNLECPSYEICLIDYGCGKFNRKIHIMEQYP